MHLVSHQDLLQAGEATDMAVLLHFTSIRRPPFVCKEDVCEVSGHMTQQYGVSAASVIWGLVVQQKSSKKKHLPIDPALLPSIPFPADFAGATGTDLVALRGIGAIPTSLWVAWAEACLPSRLALLEAFDGWFRPLRMFASRGSFADLQSKMLLQPLEDSTYSEHCVFELWMVTWL